MTLRLIAPVAAAATAVVLAGFAGTASSSGSQQQAQGGVAGARATVLRIYAKPSGIAYSTTKLTAKAGVVTIAMTNRSVLMHDVAIKGNGVRAKGKVVGKGGVSTVTAKLKKGKYTFYCTVPGHEAAGMKGTLTIT